MTEPIHSPPDGPAGQDGNAPLLVCAPLRFEARAVRRGLRDGDSGDRDSGADSGAGRGIADTPTVLRTGYGAKRSAGRLEKMRQVPFGSLAITGTGVGLAPDLSPGDLVVASEVTSVGDGARDGASDGRGGRRFRAALAVRAAGGR